MNQYTKVYLSKLAEELSTPPIKYTPGKELAGGMVGATAGFNYKPGPINYAIDQDPPTKPITVQSPNGPVTFKPYAKEKSERPDSFEGTVQPGIHMAQTYGDQLYPELAKADAYNKEHGLMKGPTAETIERKFPVNWNNSANKLSIATPGIGPNYNPKTKGITMNTEPLGDDIQAIAFQRHGPNEDKHKINEANMLRHEGFHALYDTPGWEPDAAGLLNSLNAVKNTKQDNYIDGDHSMDGEATRDLPHAVAPAETRVFLSNIQQNQFKQTGSRFDSKQWGDTLDKIFPEGRQVSNRDFEKSISQFPPDSRRMFREIKEINKNNPKQFQVIKNWQSERMPGITQNSPLTIGSRNVS